MRQPVILLGAARSGTKLLRSVIAAADEYRPVEYDVNYIWRFGNSGHPDDALPAHRATPRVARFIRKQLPHCAGIKASEHVSFVEKTVCNILRIPFVQCVYPEAKYVCLIRDGRDVIESAERCWREPPQLGYLRQKLKTFPWLHCAPYGVAYVRSFASRALGLSKQLSTWGPRYPGIADDVRSLDLLEVCAWQWVRCMEAYELTCDLIAPSQLLEVRYESLVQDMDHEIGRLCDFLEIDSAKQVLAFARSNIRFDNVGKHSRLSNERRDRIEGIASTVLERWGYAAPETTRRLAA